MHAYHGRADEVRIEHDEAGVELHVWTHDTHFSFNIQDIAEEVYDAVKGGILPWLMERDEAKREHERLPSLDAGVAYALSNPKHPDFHSAHADIWDMREGK